MIQSDRSYHSVGCSSENEKWLDGIVELEDQRQEDQEYGGGHDHSQFAESLVLLVIIAAHANLVTGWQVFLEFREFRAGCFQNFRRKHTASRKTADCDRPEMIQADNALGVH